MAINSPFRIQTFAYTSSTESLRNYVGSMRFKSILLIVMMGFCYALLPLYHRFAVHEKNQPMIWNWTVYALTQSFHLLMSRKVYTVVLRYFNWYSTYCHPSPT